MNSSLQARVPDDLFAELLPLAERMAARLTQGLFDGAEDVAQAARLALFDAAQRVSPDEPTARQRCLARVRGAVFDELRRQDPLSRHARARLRLIREAAEELEVSLGRVPNDSEIAEFCGIDAAQVRASQALAEAARTVSLGDHWSIACLLADPDSLSPAEEAEASDLSNAIRHALARLPARQAFVIRRYYIDGATLDEIAAELKMTRQGARRLRLVGECSLRLDAAFARVAQPR